MTDSTISIQIASYFKKKHLKGSLLSASPVFSERMKNTGYSAKKVFTVMTRRRMKAGHLPWKMDCRQMILHYPLWFLIKWADVWQERQMALFHFPLQMCSSSQIHPEFSSLHYI